MKDFRVYDYREHVPKGKVCVWAHPVTVCGVCILLWLASLLDAIVLGIARTYTHPHIL